MHAVLPLPRASRPAAQVLHCTCPGLSWNCEAPQGVQVALPEVGEKDPGLQALQLVAPAALLLPALQGVQEEAPSKEKRPAWHCRQEEEPAAD